MLKEGLIGSILQMSSIPNYQPPVQPVQPYSGQPEHQPEIDKKKVAIVSVVGIILLVALYFLISQGILAGKAVYIPETMSDAEFASLVENKIYDTFGKTAFYPSLPSVELCIQVPKNTVQSFSFRVVKAYSVFKVKQTPIPCDQNLNYDFGVKFTSYEAFESLANNLRCDNFKQTHQSKGMFVLPSKYVLAGFRPDPTQDYAPFCSALSQCLTPLEISLIGIGC
ncbi:MAG: hypothetical protein ABIA37_04155 [Candidatus Woesearchaeota archaeon]